MEARQGLCQHILRAPLAMQKLDWDEEQDTITRRSSPTVYFQGKSMHFSCVDFIARLTLHVPHRGRYLLRRYGRVTGQDAGFRHLLQDREIGQAQRRSAWARLLAKVYEVDAWACTACGGRMSIIAVIRDPAEIHNIVACLAKRGGDRLRRDDHRSPENRIPRIRELHHSPHGAFTAHTN